MLATNSRFSWCFSYTYFTLSLSALSCSVQWTDGLSDSRMCKCIFVCVYIDLVRTLEPISAHVWVHLRRSAKSQNLTCLNIYKYVRTISTTRMFHWRHTQSDLPVHGIPRWGRKVALFRNGLKIVVIIFSLGYYSRISDKVLKANVITLTALTIAGLKMYFSARLRSAHALFTNDRKSANFLPLYRHVKVNLGTKIFLPKC